MADDDKPGEAKTERFNMFMSPSEMKAIDDWAWKNRIRSKSEAVRRLCQIALRTDAMVARAAELASELVTTQNRGIGTLQHSDIKTPPEKTVELFEVLIEDTLPLILELSATSASMAEIVAALRSGESVELAMSRADEDSKALKRTTAMIDKFVSRKT